MISSQGFEIVYLEGDAYTRDQGSWQRVEVGNTLRDEAVLRLGTGAYVEVGHQEGVLRIARPGTYQLATLRRATSRARSEGVRRAISLRFRRILTDRYGEELHAAAEERIIAEGLRALALGDGRAAYELFSEAQSQASPEQMEDLSILLALSARSLQDYQSSLRLLEVGGSSLSDERALLKADILLELSAFSEAVEMVERYLRDPGRTPSERQVASVLKAQALAGMGNLGAAMATFEDAIALDPISDLGRAAREQLEALR